MGSVDLSNIELNEDAYEQAIAINALAEICFLKAKTNGFWDHRKIELIDGSTISNPSIFGEKIALVMTELAEALEAHRKHGTLAHIGEELADVVIRVFDLAAAYNIPIGTMILKKMQYNSTRPYKHGKLY